jgi:UMF1 family MFS transporter
LFSPEAGAGVVQSIVVTFFASVLRFSGLDFAKSNLILIAANLPGSYFSKWACIKFNPLNSYRAGMFMLSVSIAVAAAVLDGPGQKNAVFGFAAWWGFSMGWTYPSQRVLLCTLIPKGQETEMMGLFTFSGQILGWLPALLFTIMNENDVDMRWGLGLVPIFYMTAFVCTLPMGSYKDATELVYRESKVKLNAVIEATRHENDKTKVNVGDTKIENPISSSSEAEPLESSAHEEESESA